MRENNVHYRWRKYLRIVMKSENTRTLAIGKARLYVRKVQIIIWRGKSHYIIWKDVLNGSVSDMKVKQLMNRYGRHRQKYG